MTGTAAESDSEPDVDVRRAWDAHAMEQRISLVTLGVEDLPRARRFYEALGAFADPDGYVWEAAHNPGRPVDQDGTIHI